MLADKVLAFFQEHGMAAKGDLLIVGVSGGPDSLCLLHCLVQLQDVLGVRLHVAHLDHALRPESQDDARFVTELAARWGLPCTVERHLVREFRDRHRLSLEEAARLVRYGFFGRKARELGASGVAVGHTADDQVETLLLHWLRGSGLAGLRGMQPVTRYQVPLLGEEVNILRPLLSLQRSETEACCAALGIQPLTDISNRSLQYRRNRVRMQLLPALETFNPNIRKTLLRMSSVAKRDYEYLESQVALAWPRVATDAPGLVTLDITGVLALHPALIFNLLRTALERVAGSTAGFEWVHLEELAAALKKPAGTIIMLPHGVRFTMGYTYCTLTLGQAVPPLPAIHGETPLKAPGETLFSGWRVSASIEERIPGTTEADPWGATLDFDRTGDRLWVRPRRPGDRFQPLGMDQEKRLQDFFVDSKVPRSWRNRVPLVVSPGQLVWVAGWRIDDRVKVTASTRRVLRLRFTPLQGNSVGEGPLMGRL